MVGILKRTFLDGKETKTCPKCKAEKFLDEFYFSKHSAKKVSGYCVECTSKDRKYNREYIQKAYTEKRKVFLNMYGGRCVCCGEINPEFLTIEHRQGQRGKKRQSSYTAYTHAVKEYRPDIYEILCMNCNHSKGRYGYCPHRRTNDQ